MSGGSGGMAMSDALKRMQEQDPQKISAANQGGQAAGMQAMAPWMMGMGANMMRPQPQLQSPHPMMMGRPNMQAMPFNQQANPGVMGMPQQQPMTTQDMNQMLARQTGLMGRRF